MMNKKDAASSQKLAEERTDFAEDRTLLANERNFAGWGRTAFAAIGLGLGFQAIFNKVEPAWVPKLIATLFILLGVLLIWLAHNRSIKVLQERSEHHVNLTSSKTFLTMAVAISLGGAALITAIWFLI